MKLVKHILQYISETLDLNLIFDKEANTSDDVVRYIDSDFPRSKINQKSTRDYVFMLAKAAISHFSKLQSIIALSTCETEYVAICETKKEDVWLGYLLAELGFQKKSTLITLYTNN